MNNLQITYFIELCKTLNFTKAAQNLYVSQPAVSKQISSFEKELGIQLLDRSNKNVSLTPAGLLFNDYFVKITDEFERTLNDARKLSTQEKKCIVIGFLEAWDMSKYLPLIIKSLAENYPNISTHFVSYNHKELNNKIENNEIDIAISLTHNFESIATINSKEITKIPSLLFFSVAHPLANKPNLTVTDFKEETFFVFYDSSKLNTKDRVIKQCQPYGFTPKVSTVPNVESMVLNVKNGLGVAIFDDWIQYKHNPMLKFIKTGNYHKVDVVWSDSNLNDFVNFFIQELVVSF